MPVLRAPASPPALDVERVRADFPILRTSVRGHPLTYLDSAATSQRPGQVLAAMDRFYTTQNANIHRGVHYLSEVASESYEGVRARVARFLGAPEPESIVFTSGTTGGINLVAQAWARPLLQPGDEIIITTMEHHSNIVPWQMVCEERGAALRVVPVTDRGELVLEELERLLSPRTRLVAVTHLSNVLGTVNPVEEIVRLARDAGARVLIDGAQSAAHLPVDLTRLDCDFYVCSGHKMLGPTGVGVLYGRPELLASMPPWQGGGGMIASVTLERTTFAPPPARFEAGTPPIAEVIGLGAAIDYLEAAGLEAIHRHEDDLLQYATGELAAIPGL
ncbi:MAG: aminotransferase class V-fold PLP-dependent enzyme, partial [Gemmatimonadales bacterium]